MKSVVTIHDPAGAMWCVTTLCAMHDAAAAACVQARMTAARTCEKGTQNLFLLAQDVHYHVTALVIEVQALAQRMTLQPSRSRT